MDATRDMVRALRLDLLSEAENIDVHDQASLVLNDSLFHSVAFEDAASLSSNLIPRLPRMPLKAFSAIVSIDFETEYLLLGICQALAGIPELVVDLFLCVQEQR
jgi:ABC-type tungstate transport system substrate-binding protein